MSVARFTRRTATRVDRARVVVAMLALAAVLAPRSARAAGDGPEDELAVRMPVRLTAGAANHLMGERSPTKDALYFIGDEVGTNEVLVQEPISGGPEPLFDAQGDYAFPRVSPDGKFLAYVSYVSDSTGDACVRDLRENQEFCLTGPETSELEVVWLDAGHLGVLSRADLHSGFAFARFDIGSRRRTLLFERDMIGIARLPNGTSFAYVAIERRRDQVGVSFSARVGRGLRIQRVENGAPVGDPIVYDPDLPGVTGFPAYARDGRHLYFSQYLNDTNRDGVIDGGDNSVIVRVAVDPERGTPLAEARAEQLTTSRWNCHYPAPADDALVMTCSHGGSLDLYSLPLDGVVPEDWAPDRLRAELGAARDLWAKLLIASRLRVRVTDREEVLDALAYVVCLHLELREYESALYYAQRIASSAGPDSARGRWARLFEALTRHRREDLELTRGQLSRAYVQSERARVDDVRSIGRPTPDGGGPTPGDLAALTLLVTAEIRDDLGDKAAALADLTSVDLASVTDPHTRRLAGETAAKLYGHLADRNAILSTYARLATHPGASASERLEYSVDYVGELSRGRSGEARRSALASARASAPDGSELALLLDVENDLATLDDANQEEVRAKLFARYQAERDPLRRRAIALSTVRAASQVGNEYLQYQFATTWASGLGPHEPERRYAEELYRAIVLERAYGELSDGHIDEAASYFFQTSRNVGALDAHIGFIEARIARSHEDMRAFYDQRFRDKRDDPGYLFALAYLDARELPRIDDPARHARVVQDVIERLRRVDAAWPRRIEVHHLWAYTLHLATLETGSRRDAGAANSHYLLALDLARDRPRARAAILFGVGLLQASLSNHRRALEHFERRARLPFLHPETELAFELARARSQFHARRPADARTTVERAWVLLESKPELARFRVVVLDRRAFYHLYAGAFDDAARLYTQLWDSLSGPDDTSINRLKASIGLASSSLHRQDYAAALVALERAERVLASDPRVQAAPQRSLLDAYVYTHERYSALVTGLRGEALAGLGRYEESGTALASRTRDVERFFEESEANDDLLAIAQARFRQTQVARAGGREEDAVHYAEAGLARIDAYDQATGGSPTDTSLTLLGAYAEIALFGNVPRERFARDLEADLLRAYRFMTRYPSPRWAADRARFELYLALLRTHPSAMAGVSGIRE